MIDTSTSYFDGESEQLIGTVINGMLEEKVIQRDEIIIASKVGTIKGSVLEYAKQQEENGTPYSNVVCCFPKSTNVDLFVGKRLKSIQGCR